MSTQQIRDVTIAGVNLTVDVPYADGHTLNAAEASQLNQVYIENIANNFRKRVAELSESGKSTEEIQSELDKYAESYVFGARKVGAGGPRISDPVEREMHALAKKALTEHFKKKDISFSEMSADDRQAAIKVYLERYGDKVRPLAQSIVDAAAAARSIGELPVG